MPTNVIMPQMGESVAEGTITKWLRKAGEHIGRDEPLFEISTDKVDAEIPSPAAGILSQILVKENETVAVNTVVAVIDGEGVAVAASAAEVEGELAGPPAPPAAAAPLPAAAAASALPAAGSPSAPTVPEEARSSPLVRRIARDYQVDLTQVRGTGLGGRISKKDILAYVEQRQSAAAARAPAAPPPSSPPAAVQPASTPSTFAGPTRVVAMTPMRR